MPHLRPLNCLHTNGSGRTTFLRIGISPSLHTDRFLNSTFPDLWPSHTFVLFSVICLVRHFHFSDFGRRKMRMEQDRGRRSSVEVSDRVNTVSKCVEDSRLLMRKAGGHALQRKHGTWRLKEDASTVFIVFIAFITNTPGMRLLGAHSDHCSQLRSTSKSFLKCSLPRISSAAEYDSCSTIYWSLVRGRLIHKFDKMSSTLRLRSRSRKFRLMDPVRLAHSCPCS